MSIHKTPTCLWHVSMQTAMYQRIFEGKRDSGIFIFAFSDNLISKYWFFAEGERFLSFWRCHRPRKRAALGVWYG